jgi:hypothetical protein
VHCARDVSGIVKKNVFVGFYDSDSIVFEVFLEPIRLYERLGMRVLSGFCSHKKETSRVAQDWARNFRNSIDEEALRSRTVHDRKAIPISESYDVNASSLATA